MCVCVCEGEGEGREGSGVVLGGSVGWWVCVGACVCVVLVFVSVVLVFVSLCLLYLLIPEDCWKWTGSSGKANDWRTRERVVLDVFSDLEWVRTKGFFGEPLGSRDNITWANFGKQNWLWPPALRVWIQKTPPCVRSKRLRVYQHHARMQQVLVHVEALKLPLYTTDEPRFHLSHANHRSLDTWTILFAPDWTQIRFGLKMTIAPRLHGLRACPYTQWGRQVRKMKIFGPLFRRCPLKNRRIWMIKLAIEEALRRNALSGASLRRLDGHLSYALQLRRPCLSILSSMDALIDAYPLRIAMLWSSVRRELRWTASILPSVFPEIGMHVVL